MDELDLYDNIKHGTASRRDWVEKGGVGFNVDPLVILNAPKNEEINAVEKAT